MVSIVVPLFNEASHVRESLILIREVTASSGSPMEVLAIDDGSSDGTWDRLLALRDAMPDLRLVRLSRNFGKEAAISAGLEHARGAAVIVIDGDLQHPPELVPEMIRLWRDHGYEVIDAVKASRGLETATYRTSATMFNSVMSRLSGFDLSGASDYKLLDRKVVDAWLRMGETRLFYRGMIAWLGFKHASIPFDVCERKGGRSAWSVIRLARLAITALTSFSSLPLHLVTLLGLVFLVAAFALALHVLYMYVSGQAVTGFATVILLQLGIGAITMVSLGIIGEYIASIYHEVKRRPRYIIAEQHDSPVPAGDPS